MSHEKHGIENLKKALKSIIDFAERIQECAKDGKINLWEKLSLVGAGTEFSHFIVKSDEIQKEFQDLSAEEYDQLVEFVRSEYDHENDKTEDIVETAFETALAVKDLIEAIKQ